MAYKIVVDLDYLREHPDFEPECGYPYQKPHAPCGPTWLIETASYEVYCRQCDEAPCVNACPFYAIELQENHKLRRYNKRCTNCRTCMLACPFGTIIPAGLTYKVPMCDLCGGGKCGEQPACTRKGGGFKWEDIQLDNPENGVTLFIVNERLAVRTKKFKKIEPSVRKLK